MLVVKIGFNSLLLCFLILVSCKSISTNDEICILDENHNIIKGVDPEAKRYFKPMSFLPKAIEELLVNKPSTQIDYEGYLLDVEERLMYAGYHIYGCSDTTNAKIEMANHLMNKYNISRSDSIYIDTLFKLEVVDETKLRYSDENCKFSWHKGFKIDSLLYWNIDCLKWKYFVNNLKPLRNSIDYINPIVNEPREGRYIIKRPHDFYETIGLEAYQKYLIDSFGVSLDIIGLDSINVGIYKVRDNK